ncbi:hypothetical protein [Sphingomonas sp.]|uniref:hypothetical protein n=1 Tax=Sphingomonas sp. TaxID=28214 RepID=UPI002DD6A628|nr:hypothetical protein [Sphingomonas sp.]
MNSGEQVSINRVARRDDVKSPERKSPNPGGSKGGPAHREKIKERIRELEGEGMEHVAGGDKPEERVDTPGGEKGYRRPDITMDDNGTPYRENVGRQTKSRGPIFRERRAQNDIEQATGQCAFTAYNDCD